MKHIRTPATAAACDCGSPLGYAQCCGRWHGGEPAPDAEALMRSRYSAYVRGNAAYLLATWHPSTSPSPDELDTDLQQRPTWLGLSVHRHLPGSVGTGDEDTAQVEFTARFRIGGGSAQRMRELSRFRREDGRWYYVDGDVG